MLNPLGAMPFFLSITAQQPNEARQKIARQAAVGACIVLIVGATIGQFVLDLFGITIASFRVIGGVLFLITALDMLNVRQNRTKQTPEEESEAEGRPDIALVPLATPMLAGPGSISSVLLYMQSAPKISDKAVVYGVIVALGIVVYLFLRLAEQLSRALGTTGTNILTRMMGLIVGAIAVEYVVGGIQQMLLPIK